MEGFKRKTPDEILRSISKLHMGRFKVLVGAVSGSGKTYHMLREGQILKQQSVDVVICAVSTMQRPETVEQLGDLERIPSIKWMKDGTEKKDLNLDAIIERNPEVVLVDGLAHRNRTDAMLSTRVEDIKYLISRGISVITTVNVYEIEGIADIARQMTGVQAEDTIAASVLELADEVRLIDVTPETMLKRVTEGILFKHSAPGFYDRGKLGVLRELALRIMAEGVNDSLEKYREELGLYGPSGASERVLVSAQYHWNGSIYVRRGQQIAKRLNGSLLVVTFVNENKSLSKEAETFKRSIRKLVEKVGGTFEELAFRSRRSLPDRLVRYALKHSVTRIVLGHSKQSRWQELRQGSFVGKVLRRTRNIDVFIVADRAEHEGERILPARNQREEPIDLYRRLSVGEVEQKIDAMKRGTFKVYIGAAPGVGKTYTMLREGNVLFKRGIDVVIGLLETHGRQHTQEQVGDLPLVPRKQVPYGNTVLTKMDVEAILQRNPEVVLIDELAHTNIPGSERVKRYEDVLRILAAGISVISTMNIQHVESLNDSVEQITGIRVRETVPDFVLRQADEVELIDVTPAALQERMQKGHIYSLDKVEQALGNFFKTVNLIALRELALREIADDVDERLESWERKGALRGPWRRQEMIFVCVTLSPNAERLIRRGFRIAHRLKARWMVSYVHAGGSLSSEDESRCVQLKELTHRLGGDFHWVSIEKKREVAQEILRQAEHYQATQLIMGQSRRTWVSETIKGSVLPVILRYARHMDVLVVADFDPHLQADFIEEEGERVH